MDSIFANIQQIAFQDDKIVSFFNFSAKVHELSNCKEVTCEIKLFVKTLKMYFADKEKTESDRRDFFISHCSYFKRVFKSILI